MEVMLLLRYGMVVFVVWFVCSLVGGGGEVKRSYPGRSCKSDRSLVKETFLEVSWHGGHVTVAVWDGGFCCFGVVGVKGSYPGSTWKSDRPLAKETLEVMLLLQYWFFVCLLLLWGGGRVKGFTIISRRDLEMGEAIGNRDIGSQLVCRSCYYCSIEWWVFCW